LTRLGKYRRFNETIPRNDVYSKDRRVIYSYMVADISQLSFSYVMTYDYGTEIISYANPNSTLTVAKIKIHDFQKSYFNFAVV
jgi:hypothetical protein